MSVNGLVQIRIRCKIVWIRNTAFSVHLHNEISFIMPIRYNRYFTVLHNSAIHFAVKKNYDDCANHEKLIFYYM